MAEVPSLVEVLAMLAGGMGVGTVISFLLEKVGLFQGLRSRAKWWVVLGLNLGLPLAAGFLGCAGSQVALRGDVTHRFLPSLDIAPVS